MNIVIKEKIREITFIASAGKTNAGAKDLISSRYARDSTRTRGIVTAFPIISSHSSLTELILAASSPEVYFLKNPAGRFKTLFITAASTFIPVLSSILSIISSALASIINSEIPSEKRKIAVPNSIG